MSAKVILKPKRAQPFFGRHPWVFAGAIERVEGDAADGDEVDLVSHGGNFVARGLFNGQSKIRVRLYSWEEGVPLDADFFRDRLARAIRLRHDVLKLNRPDAGYRVVYSESDFLSGMVVDRYGEWLAVQFTALGLANRRESIAGVLRELLNPRGIYLRTEKGIGKLEGVELHDQLLWGEPPPADLTIDENGLCVLVNLAEGQKTGYYLDQRDNRLAVAQLCAGRRVLDAFCYSGGFGLHAAKAGAMEVLGVDASEPALELARRNAAANEPEQRFFRDRRRVPASRGAGGGRGGSLTWSSSTRPSSPATAPRYRRRSRAIAGSTSSHSSCLPGTAFSSRAAVPVSSRWRNWKT